MKIKFLGQSGYELRSGGTRIFIDPYFSDSVNRVSGRARLLPIPLNPRDLQCDAVICTHDHLDHLDPDTVCQISKAQFFITTGEGKAHLEALGRTNVAVLHPGESMTVGDFQITAVFADHTVEAIGLMVEWAGKKLYFSGDTLYNEQLFAIADHRPDVTFICINGRLGNMNVEEAIKVAKTIGAKVNIPNHYDMFASNSEDPHLFADRMDGSRILEFNKSYSLEELLGKE